MGTLDWRPFADIDSVRLQEARLQAHHAVQWLARAARAFVPALADDSHTNLGWEHDFGGFATHKLQGARVGLKLAPLTLALLQGTAGTTTRTFVLAGRTEADARAWLGQEMNGLGLDARKLDIELPYQLPFHEIANGGTYASSGIDDALHELSTWYANADQSLYRLREAMSGKNLNASPVRCWPHHFDLATLIALDAGEGTGESARSIGVGLSPGDEHYNEPYFYVTPWPYPAPSRLPPLPQIGRWHTKGFVAAVTLAHRILAAPARQGETEKFLTIAVAASMQALG